MWPYYTERGIMKFTKVVCDTCLKKSPKTLIGSKRLTACCQKEFRQAAIMHVRFPIRIEWIGFLGIGKSY